jgi:hypothetical protein
MTEDDDDTGWTEDPLDDDEFDDKEPRGEEPGREEYDEEEFDDEELGGDAEAAWVPACGRTRRRAAALRIGPSLCALDEP